MAGSFTSSRARFCDSARIWPRRRAPSRAGSPPGMTSVKRSTTLDVFLVALEHVRLVVAEDGAFDSGGHLFGACESGVEQHRHIARRFRFQMPQRRSRSLPQRSGSEFFGLAAPHQKQPPSLQSGGLVQQRHFERLADELLRLVQLVTMPIVELEAAALQNRLPIRASHSMLSMGSKFSFVII